MEVITHRISDYDDEGDFPDEYQLLGEEPVTLETKFPAVLVVDNLPIVASEDKFSKLKVVMTRLYAQNVVQIDIPRDASGSTVGFAFIEFTSVSAAQEALNRTNNYKLDRSHVFRVNFFDDFSLYDKLEDTFVPEELPPFKPKENLLWWLAETEGRARDQYVIKHADMTEIYWNDGRKRSEPILKKKLMTETYVQWSPFGRYLASFHQEGVILWGGPNWDKIVRFRHPGVKLLDFSPKENYLVTISNQYQNNDNPQDPQCIIVWDVRSGRKMRGFLGNKEGGMPAWPVFKWSHDEKFFARHSEDTISVYETPGMNMLQNKSLKIPDVRDFDWSPTDNMIACWVPEAQGKPASVQIIDLPSRNVRRTHNLFKVQECHLHWSPTGDYLCIKVDRTATKKVTTTSFELCRMRDKTVAIETLQINDPHVLAFAWEPKGHRFAIVHGESASRPDVSFYTMEGKKHQLLKKLEKRTVNNLFWSPRGGQLILAGIGSSMGGYLEFFNVDDMETMRSDSHHMLTDVAWDPTGRYVLTSTSHWRVQLDTGFSLWTFQGKQLWHVTRDKFYQILWRPRPPSLLPVEKQKEIEKKLKEYSNKYRKEDLRKKRAVQEAWKQRRQAQKDDFYKLKLKRLEERKADKALRVKLEGDSDDESGYYEREEEVEELLDDSTQVVEADD